MTTQDYGPAYAYVHALARRVVAGEKNASAFHPAQDACNEVRLRSVIANATRLVYVSSGADETTAPTIPTPRSPMIFREPV